MLTTVAVSFVTTRRHNRPRIVGLFALLMSLGFALFSLPHFLAGPYRLPAASSNSFDFVPNNGLSSSTESDSVGVCSAPRPTDTSKSSASYTPLFLPSTPSSSSSEHSNRLTTLFYESATNKDLPGEAEGQSASFPVFCVALLLAGIGASPLYVLGPTYLWDNLTDKQYPIYSAFFYSAAALGPACGFLIGAGFLSLYVDAPTQGTILASVLARIASLASSAFHTLTSSVSGASSDESLSTNQVSRGGFVSFAIKLNYYIKFSRVSNFIWQAQL
ncbi:unnamed protein product [Protopolystoma xenopodis]|uniref:Major facilitator superfamily (MFS) profile domain-containing protein n=1 Tax=Protopolystoma xenopodis TaxID=117903 RepID=A0A3S5AWK7_9PLAT|nr:unnamed protein product [Protopolystoma xenopodis]